MPSRRSHRQDPVFRNIERWDDGYDARTAAVPPVPPVPDTRMPYYPPPPQQTGPSTKTAKYIPKYAMEDRETRPRSPPPDSYEFSKPRRTRHRSPSPLRRSYPLNRDEGNRHRDREGRHDPPAPRRPVTRRPSFHAVKTTPAPFAGGRTTPSPSPPPTYRRSRRDRDTGRDGERPRSHSPPPRRHHSPAPPRRTKTTNNSPSSPAKHSSRNKATVAAAAPHRPGLARSKTTAAALGRNATEILSNPRFQKAAAAALQAGGMAALRQWKAPGAWAGQKGASVATAALGAAAMDAFAKAEAGGSTKPARSSPDGGGGKNSGGAVKSVGSALGGLLVAQLAKSGSGKRDKR